MRPNPPGSLRGQFEHAVLSLMETERLCRLSLSSVRSFHFLLHCWLQFTALFQLCESKPSARGCSWSYNSRHALQLACRYICVTLTVWQWSSVKSERLYLTVKFVYWSLLSWCRSLIFFLSSPDVSVNLLTFISKKTVLQASLLCSSQFMDQDMPFLLKGCVCMHVCLLTLMSLEYHQFPYVISRLYFCLNIELLPFVVFLWHCFTTFYSFFVYFFNL